MTLKIAFAMTHLTVSQIPIGLIPGFLSRATNLHAIRVIMPCGCTYFENSLLAMRARELLEVV